MSFEGETYIPATGLEIPDTGSALQWLQASMDDEWFVVQSLSESLVTAFNRTDGTILQRTFQGIDEPHIDRNGRYVLIVDLGGGDITCGGANENYWHLWDLATDTVYCRGPVYGGHVGWVRGYFDNGNPDVTAHDFFYYDPDLDSVTNTAEYKDANSFVVSHRAGQWMQGTDDTTQWIWGSNYNDGRVLLERELNEEDELEVVGQWYHYSGDIYRTTELDFHWGAYHKAIIGIQAVYEASATNPNSLEYTLEEVGSVGEMTAGTFYYDDSAKEIFVWRNGGVDPTGYIHLYAPTALHRGIGARRINGQDARFLVHNYAIVADYWDHPFATVSPDGRLVMFTSNMGLAGGRTDNFIVEVPLSGSTPPPPPPPSGTVSWTALVNATATGALLEKTGGCDGCSDAGAISNEQITSGDGYIQFEATAPGDLKWIGLSSTHSGTGGSEIEFALRFDSTAWASVRLSGVYTSDSPYSAGDIFRISVEAGDVVFSKNETVYYTASSAGVSYPLVVDTSLYSAGATFDDVEISVTTPSSGSVTWTDLADVTVTGTTLQKTAGCEGCSAGAVSEEEISSGDGYVEVTAVANDELRAFGLSYGNTDTSFSDIDFAIVLRAEGYFEVYENGVYKSHGENYSPNDVFRVAIESGDVLFYQNSSLIYTSATSPTYPLLLDTCLLSLDARIDSAQIADL